MVRAGTTSCLQTCPAAVELKQIQNQLITMSAKLKEIKMRQATVVAFRANSVKESGDPGNK